MGVYLYTSQVDESLLRKHKRMPGSIYYGDISDFTTIQNLWDDERSWMKKASRNLQQKNNREDIQFLLNATKQYNDAQFLQFVETYLNKPAFFKFIALDRLLGSYHHDFVHNHKIYFDPYLGKFEPISWDIRFWDNIPQKDLSLYPLQLRLTSHPAYDAQIDKIVYSLISAGTYAQMIEEYEKIIDSILPDLERDISRDRSVRLPFISNETISETFELPQFLHTINSDKAILKQRFEYLQKLYDTTELAYSIKQISDTQYKLSIIVDGHSPVNADFSQLSVRELPENQSAMRLYSARKIAANAQVRYPQKAFGSDLIVTHPQQYEFTITAENMSEKELLAQIKWTNHITGKLIIPLKKQPEIHTKKVLAQPQVLQPGNKQSKKSVRKVELSGRIEVTENLIFEKNTQVIIKAGTTFILHPKKSIYFYGKVVAKPRCPLFSISTSS